MTQEMVPLRGGAEVVGFTLETTQMSLKGIYQNPQCPTALYELTMACRDNTHEVFGRAIQERLKGAGLVTSFTPSGRAEIHDDIRAIVLASTEGEGLAIRLVSPYQV